MLSNEDQIAVLKRQRVLVQKELDATKDEVKNLEQKLKSLQEQFSIACDKNKKLYKENQSLIENENDYQSTISSLAVKNFDLETKLTNLQSENKKLEERFTFSTRRNKELSDEVAKLNNKLRRSENFADRLFKRVRELNTNEKELDEIRELFELSSTEAQELKEKNQRLEAKTHSYEISFNSIKSGESTLLIKGKEEEKYDGESKDIILDILKHHLNSLNKFQRRYTILNSILETNTEVGERNKILNEVKSIFQIGNGVDMYKYKMKELNDIGLDIYKLNNHYKIGFINDNRYSCTIASTPSDTSRGHMNSLNFLKANLF